MRVLGVESSCDETGLAIYDSAQGLMAHALHSQVATHAEYGGVVPELASRDHVRRVVPLTRRVLAEAGCRLRDIDAVAYTRGPGLVGALMVGAGMARSLAWGWRSRLWVCTTWRRICSRPCSSRTRRPSPSSPCWSPAATRYWSRWRAWVATGCSGIPWTMRPARPSTRPPSCSACPTPAGRSWRNSQSRGPGALPLPRPMTDRPGLDFSFSGLKTRVLQTVQQSREADRADIAAAFQSAVVDTLVIKCRRALRETGSQRLVISGGVGANGLLREQMRAMADQAGPACITRGWRCVPTTAPWWPTPAGAA